MKVALKEKNITDDVLIEITSLCEKFLEEKKAEDIKVLDLREINSFLDFFIIASVNSLVHLNSLSKDVHDFLRKQNLKERGKPESGDKWIVIDFNEIVVHLFTKDARNFYQLDRLWGDSQTLFNE